MLLKNHTRSEILTHINWESFSDPKVHMKYELHYCDERKVEKYTLKSLPILIS